MHIYIDRSSLFVTSSCSYLPFMLGMQPLDKFKIQRFLIKFFYHFNIKILNRIGYILFLFLVYRISISHNIKNLIFFNPIFILRTPFIINSALFKRLKFSCSMYLLNKFDDSDMNLFLGISGLKLFSFDKFLADKYHIYHLPLRLDRNYLSSFSFANSSCPFVDIFFVGSLKQGREETLIKIADHCDKLNLSYLFFFPDTPSIPFKKCYNNTYLDYYEILEQVYASNSVVEILQPGVSSSTLRLPEVMFFNKKLITNASIVYQDSVISIDEFLSYDKNDFLNFVTSSTSSNKYYTLYTSYKDFFHAI